MGTHVREKKARGEDEVLAKAAAACGKRGVVIPTFAQLRDPSLVPEAARARLKKTSLSAVDPVNLFRIGWHNDAATGLFGAVNAVEVPRALTGIEARVIGLVGSRFPTGAHKVGAAFGCLVPRLVSGRFDPATQKAVWPSTGNYCRGGAFDSALLGCDSVAILPEGMSRERFDWLKSIGSEIIATPGTESNVKEIYDMCDEVRRTRADCVIFNQFAEFGNPTWHYHVTGPAAAEAFEAAKARGGRLAAFVSATGSAGTIAAGDYLRKRFPGVRVAAVEPVQCPTLTSNGFGEHRIEGIGDKHVPWIHNVRNTDLLVAVDDESCMRVLRLFNEASGRKLLAAEGLDPAALKSLELLGISGICNLLAAIKLAKHDRLGPKDVVVTVFTDSVELYRSRLGELTAERGRYTPEDAGRDLEGRLRGVGTDWVKELGLKEREAVHNLKYFTWVEQQGKSSADLRRLWDPEFWDEAFAQAEGWDKRIGEFNRAAGRG
ncbi:MAG: pyridoxal-phosphate dependent protein [Elusimicrobia bacterium]|nr:MAG: pyridoxal-phosphate dependent protein [Elusimicrobiota bacterium]